MISRRSSCIAGSGPVIRRLGTRPGHTKCTEAFNAKLTSPNQCIHSCVLACGVSGYPPTGQRKPTGAYPWPDGSTTGHSNLLLACCGMIQISGELLLKMSTSRRQARGSRRLPGGVGNKPATHPQRGGMTYHGHDEPATGTRVKNDVKSCMKNVFPRLREKRCEKPNWRREKRE